MVVDRLKAPVQIQAILQIPLAPMAPESSKLVDDVFETHMLLLQFASYDTSSNYCLLLDEYATEIKTQLVKLEVLINVYF